MESERSPLDLQRAAIAAYGCRCLSYYEGWHPTSRFFDHLVLSRFRKERLPITSGSLWLEVGSGRGQLLDLAPPRVRFRRCYLDITWEMLRNCSDGAALARILGTAFRMPLRDSVADGVLSVLGDAFNSAEYFAEAHRILKPAGHLIHVVPSTLWGHQLRHQLGCRLDEAVFVGQSRKRIRAPSLLHDVDTLKALLVQGGFQRIAVEQLYPEEQPLERLPPEVAMVLAARHMKSGSLPVLFVVSARS